MLVSVISELVIVSETRNVFYLHFFFYIHKKTFLGSSGHLMELI
jgi:hypothetical protein